LADDDTDYLENVGGAALYRSVVRAMAEGVVIHDESGRILDANPSAERILGLSHAQLSGRSPLDPRWRLILPDGTPATSETIPSEITQRTGVACRNRHLGVHRPTGELAWLLVNTDPVRDANGRLRLVVATFTDITESVRARSELEVSRGHLKHVIDIAPGIIYQYLRHEDGHESLPFMSERVRTLLGLEPAALIDAPAIMWERAHPDDVRLVSDAFDRSQRELTPVAVEARFRGPRGDWLWLRSEAIPDRVAQGVLWTGIILDVTRDHAIAERMRRAARREAMGELAAGLAHNFNNLLAAILPNIELALQDEGDPVPLLEDALHASRNAADLVRQLLALTRSDAPETALRPVELVAVVRDTLRFCRRTFDSRIRIEERIDAPPILVLGQVSNLQQVVMNLCLNARDAMAKVPEARLTVELTTAAGEGGEEARLSVSDSGIGMSPETMKHLGEPFFTTKAAGQGTGLGLATIYGIVRDAGGSIRCHSELGKGTRFEVRLPRCPPRDEPGDVVATREAERELRGLVMLVDDEPPVRTALCRQLASIGLETVEAAGGEEALALLAESRRTPDAILLDLAMPGMPGEKVLAELVLRWPWIPVVVVTGNRGPNTMLDGASAVLAKPLTRAALVETLEALLAIRSAPGAR
jgi:PAS domain S-box-containing protein